MLIWLPRTSIESDVSHLSMYRITLHRYVRDIFLNTVNHVVQCGTILHSVRTLHILHTYNVVYTHITPMCGVCSLLHKVHTMNR